MNITDLVTGGIGSKAISAIAKTLNIDESKAKWIVAAAVPLMIAALNYNAKNKGQADSIDQAAEKHNEGGIFDKIGDLLGQGDSSDGSKIVNHMFGKNTETVTQNIASKTGISSSQIGSVLATLAPIVMGYLGNQKQTQSSGGGVADILGGLLSGGSSDASSGGLGGLLGSLIGGGAKQDQESAPSTDTSGLGDLVGEFFNQGSDANKKGNILDSLAGMFAK